MEKNIKLLLFSTAVLIVNNILPCFGQANKDLAAKWTIHDDNITLEYENLSNDTVYVASMTPWGGVRRNEFVLPKTSKDGIVKIPFFFLAEGTHEESNSNDHLKLRLGERMIPPKKILIVTYPDFNYATKKILIEYSEKSSYLSEIEPKNLIVILK